MLVFNRLIMIGLVFLLIYSSCTTNSPGVEEAFAEKALIEGKTGKIERGNHLARHPLSEVHAFLHNSDKYTWSDLDHYYRDSLPNQRNNPHDHQLRSLSIAFMFKEFDMAQLGSRSDLEYYFNEISSMEHYFDPEVIALCLDGLSSHWTDLRVATTAKEQLDKWMKYKKKIYSTDDYQGSLNSHAQGLAQLKRLAKGETS